jgi:hypothetical protein
MTDSDDQGGSERDYATVEEVAAALGRLSSSELDKIELQVRILVRGTPMEPGGYQLLHLYPANQFSLATHLSFFRRAWTLRARKNSTGTDSGKIAVFGMAMPSMPAKAP